MFNRVWRWKQQQRQEELMTLAWTTAYLTRVEKFPELGSMLRHIRGGPSDTDVMETKRVVEQGLKRLEAARAKKRIKPAEKTDKT